MWIAIDADNHDPLAWIPLTIRVFIVSKDATISNGPYRVLERDVPIRRQPRIFCFVESELHCQLCPLCAHIVKWLPLSEDYCLAYHKRIYAYHGLPDDPPARLRPPLLGEVAETLKHRSGHGALERFGSQQRLFARVDDVGRLYEHRGHLRGAGEREVAVAYAVVAKAIGPRAPESGVPWPASTAMRSRYNAER